MIILVTGGAGYVGSKFCYDAISKGNTVIVVDNLSTGKEILIPKKAIFFKCDFGDQNKIDFIIKKYKIKTVAHFAAATNVAESILSPLKYYSNNTISTENFIKTCTKNKINKLIFSSTCAVYGDLQKKLVSENDQCLPKSAYAKSKLLCEIILYNYSVRYKFGLVILRYFNVIGADKYLRTGCVNNIGQLFKTLSENTVNKKYKINIFGKNYNTEDGTCVRDFIDVNDLSDYHLALLNKIKKNQRLTINCGYRKGYSIKQVISLFEKEIGKKIKKIYLKKRDGDIEKIVCDNKKLKKILKIKKKTKIEDSIRNSILWEKKIKRII